MSAPIERLKSIKGLGAAAITELKIVEASAHQLARGQVQKRTVLSSWSSVLDYCRTAMAFADKEQLRVLFLDKRNRLIADEVPGAELVIVPDSGHFIAAEAPESFRREVVQFAG